VHVNLDCFEIELPQKGCLDYDLAMSTQAWVDLDKEDIRRMLISLIGNRFGAQREEHLDEIREERAH